MPNSPRRLAFSLLEILITAVVLAIAITPLLLSMKTSTRTVTGTREYLTAVAFAQRTLEELRRATFRKDASPLPGTSGVDIQTVLASLDEMAQAMNTDRAIDAKGWGNTLVENNVQYKRTVRLVPSEAEIAQKALPDLRLSQIDIVWKPINGSFLQAEQKYQLFSLVGSAQR